MAHKMREILEGLYSIQPLERQEVQEKIAQGLESLRLGRSVDGEAFFDRLEAEFDELER
jgi:hypothetical protein